MIKIGSKAPDFQLESHLNTKFSLSEFYDIRNVLLVFYPKDWTFT
tara:strand:+ start:1137 stop:1271 length:135 start_codon:yes stop_codon:yes gene_type:complete